MAATIHGVISPEEFREMRNKGEEEAAHQHQRVNRIPELETTVLRPQQQLVNAKGVDTDGRFSSSKPLPSVKENKI